MKQYKFSDTKFSSTRSHCLWQNKFFATGVAVCLTSFFSTLPTSPARAEAIFVSHAGNINPQSITSQQEIEITIKVGCDNGQSGVQDDDFITDAEIYYTKNGTNPSGFGGVAQRGSFVVPMKWIKNDQDSGCPTGSAAHWQGKIPKQPNHTVVKYIIETFNRKDTRPVGHIWADSVSYNRGVSTLLLRSSSPTVTTLPPTVFGYYVQDDYPTPENPKDSWTPAWAKEAIFYHIFVDRFRDGDTSNNKSQTTPGDDCQGFTPKGYCTFDIKRRNGGDLQGIIDALDYLQGLGINALWISPIYKSDKYHGYDVLDYQSVEPSFGNNQKLEELVNSAHAKGIHVVLDFVPNHTSNKNSLFKGAQSNCLTSPFVNFYIFSKCPTAYIEFGNAPSQPKINLQFESAREFMLGNVSKWLGDDFNNDGTKLNPGSEGFLGIDGYRMDYAQGADPCKDDGCNGGEPFTTNQSFWRLYRSVVKSLNPQSFTFAENTFGSNFQAYDDYAPELDGTLDFALRDALFNAFIGGGSPGSNLNGNNIDDLNSALLAHELNFVPGFIPVTFLSNHDQYRFYFKTGNNASVTKMAAAIQFTLKGAPIIYYGEEVGVSQDTSGDFEPTRKRMVWEADSKLPSDSGWIGGQNKDLFNFYKNLINLRKNYRAVRNGLYSSLWRNNDQDTLAYARYLLNADAMNPSDDSVIVAMNLNPNVQNLSIPNQVGNGTSLSADLHLPNGTVLQDRISGDTFTVQGGKINLNLNSQQLVILAKKRL
jgi:cyclomaltodextrinase / maltogenic alpha-amylase / neopullulanase